MRGIMAQNILFEELKLKLRNKELKSGDKLPPERDLASTLQISRSTTREALKTLETMGILECIQGSGYYIKNNFDDALLESFTIFFLALGQPTLELIEFRQGIEEKALELAVAKITPERIEKLESILNKISVSNNIKNAELDIQFHEEIIKASENIFLISVYNSSRIIISEFIHQFSKKIIKNIQPENVLFNHHKEILEAIKIKDTNLAMLKLRNHFDLLKENL